MTGESLRLAGFAVDDAAAARLAVYVDGLLAINQQINLTGAREPALLWAAHVCDSLALLPLIDESAPASLLDLGSGGGLPGLAIACARPGLPVTLLDATQKKLRALEPLIAAIGLQNVTLAWGRAEKLAHDAAYREKFEMVVARAVGPLDRLVELAAGLLAPKGLAVFFKSTAAVAPETAAAAAAARICALELLGMREYELPADQGRRALVCYAKKAPLRRDLPRDGSRIARASLGEVGEGRAPGRR